MKNFLIGLGIKVLGFATAKALEAVPRDKVKAHAQDVGVWFTEKVTPYISERSETEIQEILNEAHDFFNHGADHDDEV